MKDIGTLLLLGGLAIGAIIFWPKIKEFTQGLGNGQQSPNGSSDIIDLNQKVQESQAIYGKRAYPAPWR